MKTTLIKESKKLVKEAIAGSVLVMGLADQRLGIYRAKANAWFLMQPLSR